MRKSLSRNPNMLRTMIGIGMVLILVLAYAVYSNTVDSEYYGYTTTNEQIQLQMLEEVEGEAKWRASTDGALTWINVTVSGASEGSTVRVEASGTEWYHSTLLGVPDAENFNCREWSEISESCTLGNVHEVQLENENLTIRGLVTLELPIDGLGYLQGEDLSSAEADAQSLIETHRKAVTWRVSVFDDDGIVNSEGIDLSVTFNTHELVSVTEFKLDPIQESVYSFATLVGCFSLLLALPLMVYYSAMYNAKRDERIRDETPEPEQ